MARSSSTRSWRSCACCSSSTAHRCGSSRRSSLFRVFDIVKPPPIRTVDLHMKGGFGVMFDDLLAAGYTLLVLALAQRVLA